MMWAILTLRMSKTRFRHNIDFLPVNLYVFFRHGFHNPACDRHLFCEPDSNRIVARLAKVRSDMSMTSTIYDQCVMYN